MGTRWLEPVGQADRLGPFASGSLSSGTSAPGIAAAALVRGGPPRGLLASATRTPALPTCRGCRPNGPPPPTRSTVASLRLSGARALQHHPRFSRVTAPWPACSPREAIHPGAAGRTTSSAPGPASLVRQAPSIPCPPPCLFPAGPRLVHSEFDQKRLRVRDEPRDEVHFGFLVLSGCLIFFRNLKPSFC
ncbi:transposase [Stigmatella aurantiaca DW4/3-1]|uniref:Transposase n=1 Tax=Stigmatella aurantiaca (strain DW4/3-1) TaxID=378806 RepID=E3FWE1_STIAD|nr:transposase [Stigmatella aurantiaca DW4/3-1]